MRKLFVLIAAGALGLAFTATALAAYVPHIAVSQDGSKTTIHVTSAKTDDSTAKITIYAPASAAATFSQPPGTQIGTVTAQVNAKSISPDAILPLTGTVSTDDPAKYTSNPSSVACAGAAAHQAVWLLVLQAAGQTLPVPAYVDATTGAETAFGAAKLQVCLTSPDTGAACAPTFCAKLLDVNFTVTGVYAAATAPIATWASLFTPYMPGTATPNPPGTVLALGIEAKPTVTIAARAAKSGRVSISGKVTAGGIPAPGTTVGVYSGSKKLFTTKTGASGTYAAAGKLRKGSYSLRSKATVADTDVTAQGCAAAPPGAPTCVSATAAGFTAWSPTVKLRVK